MSGEGHLGRCVIGVCGFCCDGEDSVCSAVVGCVFLAGQLVSHSAGDALVPFL